MPLDSFSPRPLQGTQVAGSPAFPPQLPLLASSSSWLHPFFSHFFKPKVNSHSSAVPRNSTFYSYFFLVLKDLKDVYPFKRKQILNISKDLKESIYKYSLLTTLLIS